MGKCEKQVSVVIAVDRSSSARRRGSARIVPPSERAADIPRSR